MNPNDETFYKRLHLLYSFVAIVFGSLLWLVLCLPVVTAGPATMALYQATVRTVRRAEDHFLKTFWQTFRSHFRVGALTGTGMAVLGGFLVFCVRLANLLSGEPMWLLLSYVYTGMAIVLAIVAVFLFPALLHTRGRLLQRLKQGLFMTFRHLFTAVTCFLVCWLAGLIVSKLWIFLIFTPALCCLVNSLVMEPLFAKYDFE